MKNLISLAAIAALTILGLSSCLKESDNDGNNSYTYTGTTGLFIVNTGNAEAGIESSLTNFDYKTIAAKQDAYKKANGVGLGNDVSDIIIYGSKMYIVGSGAKTVFIASSKTQKQIAAVSTNDYTPRCITAGNGKVYVSTYDRKVLAIDTLTNAISKEYQCGPYAEGLAYIGGYLYVANSDKGGENASLTRINLKTDEVLTIKNDNIKYPTAMFTYQDAYGYGYLFFVDQGTIDADGNQKDQMVYSLSSDNVPQKLIEGNYACVTADGRIVAINAPKTTPATEPTYKYYMLTNRTKGTFCDGKDIESPTGIATDPIYGYVTILSNRKVDGVVSTTQPGYAVTYDYKGNKMTYTDADGKTQKEMKYDTGVGPAKVCYNLELIKR